MRESLSVIGTAAVIWLVARPAAADGVSATGTGQVAVAPSPSSTTSTTHMVASGTQFSSTTLVITPPPPGDLHLQAARATTDEGKRYAEASIALAAYEKSFKAAKFENDRLPMYAGAAEAAYLVQRDEKAQDYANRLLKETPVRSLTYGNAVNSGYTILGLVALRAGNMDEAERCLTESGDAKKTEQLATTGPRLDLAQALLAKGRRDAVLDYLEACGRFWDAGKPKLTSWSTLIQAGKTPDLTTTSKE